MLYITLGFYIFVFLLAVAYYALPLRHRWLALLAGSVGFYLWAAPKAAGVFFLTILVSYLCALAIARAARRGKAAARAAGIASLALIAAPLLALRGGITAYWTSAASWVVPLGISFYTLQMIAYMADVYMGRILPEKNPLKYALFVSFFPQIVQGPIPRYGRLAGQLLRGNRFEERNIVRGAQLILWGFFLKLMIADKAGVFVDAVFENADLYKGMYVLIAGVLYSVQLYADFLACVTISQGVAGLFGVELENNFAHPYGSTSIREFWRRWHISLSSWLRDYVYIPLGGNRRGRVRKYANVLITFAVSGFWHGAGYKFLFWGLLHGVYQIAGELTASIRERLYGLLRMPRGDFTRRAIQTVWTFFFVMLGWIIFRADTLRKGIEMIVSAFTVHNPWILFDDSLYRLGLDWKEWNVLLLSIATLCGVSVWQSHGCIRDWINRQHLILRWGIYVAAICAIWVFGTYGYGFNAQDFIYGGF